MTHWPDPYLPPINLWNAPRQKDTAMVTQADILAALTQLRDTGHAVIVWTPDELRDCPIDDLQDLSIERGWEIIERYNDDDEEE